MPGLIDPQRPDCVISLHNLHGAIQEAFVKEQQASVLAASLQQVAAHGSGHLEQVRSQLMDILGAKHDDRITEAQAVELFIAFCPEMQPYLSPQDPQSYAKLVEVLSGITQLQMMNG